jgi:hypothetical protein
MRHTEHHTCHKEDVIMEAVTITDIDERLRHLPPEK